MELRIAYLYPELLNIYGDRGNILTLAQRCQWRGIGNEIYYLGPGDGIDPDFYDLYFMGGGQDTLGHAFEAWLTIATLRIGDRVFAAEYVMAIDFTAIQSLSGADVNMIIGQNVISSGAWFVDFPNKRWSVE